MKNLTLDWFESMSSGFEMRAKLPSVVFGLALHGKVSLFTASGEYSIFSPPRARRGQIYELLRGGGFNDYLKKQGRIVHRSGLKNEEKKKINKIFNIL